MSTSTNKEKTLSEMVKNPMVQFIIKAALVYALWEILNWVQMHNTSFGSVWMTLHNGVRDNIVVVSSWVLRTLQYDLIQYDSVLIIKGSAGVDVGPACVGFGLLFGFAGLIISYQGSWKSKLWFIPLGWLGIHTINIIRIVVLAIISHINNDWVDFNHKYVFNTIIYIFIFLMWMWWVRFVENQEKKDSLVQQKNN